MDDRAVTDAANRTSRFELAPPRHFVLPAILLLLSETPGYGYQLVKDLEELRFGRIDRPTVYRTLSQLENDALVQSWLEAPTAGQQRRVYGLTELGARVLRAWMGIIKDERDALDRVLRRYQATSTVDAVLAEVDGGWAAVDGGWNAALRSALSSVSPTAPVPRRRGIVLNAPEDEVDLRGLPPTSSSAGVGIGAAPPTAPTTPAAPVSPRPAAPPVAPTSPAAAAAAARTTVARPIPNAPTVAPRPSSPVVGQQRYRLAAERSVVLIEVRSSVGPISFGAMGLTGWVEASVAHGVVQSHPTPTAHIEIGVDGLRSGNSLYDAELLRRIDARRFPRAVVTLCDTLQLGDSSRFRLDGRLTFHGVTRPAQGTVEVAVLSGERLTVTGEQVFDIRDFDVPSPTVLMLRIYPDVRVHLHVEAELEG
jgi:DNA-binding PadR family transcriptional regulator